MPRAGRTQKARSYVFTLFDYQNAETAFPGTEEKIRYLVWQEERCPDSNRLHLQGYVELTSPQRIAAVKRLLGGHETMHLEERRGTRAEARAYARKEETRVTGPFELGEWSGGGQGTRTDWKNVFASIQAGQNLRQMAEENPALVVRNLNGLLSLRGMVYTPPDWTDMKVIVFWGNTGVGKSRASRERFPGIYPAMVTEGGKVWFQGYFGQRHILFDDFDSEVNFRQLLRITDGYPMHVEVKGTSCWKEWDTVVFTSNFPPDYWYSDMDADRRAPLLRRITEIYQVREDRVVREK